MRIRRRDSAKSYHRPSIPQPRAGRAPGIVRGPRATHVTSPKRAHRCATESCDTAGMASSNLIFVGDAGGQWYVHRSSPTSLPPTLTVSGSPSISTGELSSSGSDSSRSSQSTPSLNIFAQSLLSDMALRPSQGTGLICQNTFELYVLQHIDHANHLNVERPVVHYF